MLVFCESVKHAASVRFFNRRLGMIGWAAVEGKGDWGLGEMDCRVTNSLLTGLPGKPGVPELPDIPREP